MLPSRDELPSAETMLAYASMLEKPKYDDRGFQLATGEIIEAACAALRVCAARAQPRSDEVREPVAWLYKCQDGSLEVMLKPLSDEQKRRGYYTGEDGEDEVDGNEAIIGPFHWAEETPLYSAPPEQPAGDVREALSELREIGNNTKRQHYKVLSQKIHNAVHKLEAALNPEARGEPKAILEATPAQHFDLPKGSRARFVRNGILEICQCRDCAHSPEARGERDADDWRDIETAPKDGRNIMVSRKGNDRSVGEAIWFEGAWRTWDGENHTRTSFIDGFLTHWRPMPAAPSDVNQGSET